MAGRSKSNRSPATRNRSTFSASARSTLAAKAANWRSRWAEAASPRSAWRAPRCTSAVCSSRSMRWAASLFLAGGQADRAPRAAAPRPRRRSLARVPRIAQAGPVAPGTRLRSGRPHRSRLATPSLGCHCDRLPVTHGPSSVGVWPRAATARGVAQQGFLGKPVRLTVANTGAPRPGTPTAPRLRGPADSPPRPPPRVSRAGQHHDPIRARAREELSRDLRRPNPDLRRLRGGVHPLRRRPGVLRGRRGSPPTPSDARRAGPTGGPPATAVATTSGPSAARAATSAPTTAARSEYFVAICTSCGNQAQVPFKPRMDKPVYCSDCFRQIKPD